MESSRRRHGGRPAVVSTAEIVRAGRALGMRRLGVNAVAVELGVSATALYRHIEGRWELERLVGESLLADLVLHDDPDQDVEHHLVSFAGQLRSFLLAHPGLAGYLQVLFPRGESGMRLLAHEMAALERRGYSTDAAIVLASAVASLVTWSAIAEERESDVDEAGYQREREAVVKMLLDDARLGPAHLRLPSVTGGEFSRLLLIAEIRGLLTVAPPGRSVHEIVADLDASGDPW
ncbi:TetR/AcrR family transcriptional regulator C-terminal domain-containing protein [Streptomonospora sp. S1-112]|uniref:TetR/AcrR family transcriptional regulator C-terminal domain-containing protein n=1 Tax=Streptomonospora mangrovi TaxID=2883123 RepID=A0A9X3SD92_9ACTN|nr:TetR/AcrR family transcriptional regulator C-terminal domain-containing protein [Streptomonospora mangrovi]MDA0564538.1 TetR/AcrR family transcriptional regulator C-terminal domain-containing protein [Streptomonospora mangrovi]